MLLFKLCLLIIPHSHSHSHSRPQVLRHGWLPVICSMLISSGGGFILKRAIELYPTIASFQPVINGQ